jgi:transforming growth factor-beta-induced protein
MKTFTKKSLVIAGIALMAFLSFTTQTAYAVKANPADMDIVEVASSDERFSILVSAVVKADLVGALKGKGPFTVFAPTNDAFEALFKDLGVGGIDDLSKEQLTPILLYHVVSGKIMAADVESGKVPTLNKDADLKIKVYNTGVKINKDTNVIITDVKASNGVIHAIDKVLLP